MELPIFNTYMNFSRHHFCCFTVAPLFVLDKSMAWNRCLQHPCFKKLCKIAQASKNSDSNAQHILSDLLKHSWFHFMPFALPGYQFPNTVMNRCFYLRANGLKFTSNFLTSFFFPLTSSRFSPFIVLANYRGSHLFIVSRVFLTGSSFDQVQGIWKYLYGWLMAYKMWSCWTWIIRKHTMALLTSASKLRCVWEIPGILQCIKSQWKLSDWKEIEGYIYMLEICIVSYDVDIIAMLWYINLLLSLKLHSKMSHLLVWC